MFCGKCGNQLPDNARFCGRCGNKIAVAANAVNNNSNASAVNTANDNSSMAAANAVNNNSNVSAANAVNNNSNASAVNTTNNNNNPSAANTLNNNNTAGADHAKAAGNGSTAPVNTFYVDNNGQDDIFGEKAVKRKKRPIGVSIVCTFFSVVFSVFIFALALVLLFRMVFDTAGLDSSDSRFYENLSLNELNLTGVVDLDSEDDVILSQYIYDNLSEFGNGRLDEDDVDDIMKDFDLSGLVGEVRSSYIDVITGKEEEASVSVDAVVSAVEDNDRLFEKVLGRELEDSDYDKLREDLESMGFEKKTELKGDSIKIPAPVQTILSFLLGGAVSAYAIIGGAIIVLAVIILLLNLHKPYAVFNYLGICITLAGAAGLVLGGAFGYFLSVITDGMKRGGELLVDVLKPFKNIIILDSAIFTGVGVALIIVFIIISVIMKLVRKRA